MYNAQGDIAKESIKKGKQLAAKEYIYQYDDTESKNWVKQIITPDNTYITRKITYFLPEVPTQESPEKQ